MYILIILLITSLATDDPWSSRSIFKSRSNSMIRSSFCVIVNSNPSKLQFFNGGGGLVGFILYTNPSNYIIVTADSEILLIQTNNTFTRRSKSDVIATGKLIIGDNNIDVLRTDTGEEYTLNYFLGEETLVVRKPNSNQAWLFTKVGN